MKAKYLVLPVLLVCGMALAADTDQLGAAFDSINGSFGLKSTFMKIVYLMEIYYGWHKWRQTGNPWSAAGIVGVAIFFTYAINKWVVGN